MRRQIAEKYNWLTIAEQTIEVYRKVLSAWGMAHRAKSTAHPQITPVGFSEPTGQAQIFADL